MQYIRGMRKRKARLSHTCNVCVKPIKEGEHYASYQEKDFDLWLPQKAHLRCVQAAVDDARSHEDSDGPFDC
jgi:hypothetical protein